MKKIDFIATTIFILSTSLVNAASFDCQKASTEFEKTICSNQEISVLDDKLTETYKKVLLLNPAVKSEQRDWHKKTSSCDKNNYVDCVKNAYTARISELSALLDSNTPGSSSSSVATNKDEQSFKDAKACLINKDYACAENITNQILANDPENIKAKKGILLINLTKCLSVNDIDCANQNIANILKIDPENKEVLNVKAQIIQAQSANNKGDAQLNNTPLTKKGSIPTTKEFEEFQLKASLDEAKNYSEHKNFVIAKKILNEIIAEHPENAYPKQFLLEVNLNECLNSRDYDCANQNIADLLKINPENKGVLDTKASIVIAQKNDKLFKDFNPCITKKDYVCAVKILDEVIANDPTNEDAKQKLVAVKVQAEIEAKISLDEINLSKCLEAKDYGCARKNLEDQEHYAFKNANQLPSDRVDKLRERSHEIGELQKKQGQDFEAQLVAKFKAEWCKDVDTATKGKFAYKGLSSGDLCLVPEILLSNILSKSNFSTIKINSVINLSDSSARIIDSISNKDYQFVAAALIVYPNIKKIYLSVFALLTCAEDNTNSLNEGNSFRKALENKYGKIDSFISAYNQQKENTENMRKLQNNAKNQAITVQEAQRARDFKATINNMDSIANSTSKDDVSQISWNTDGQSAFLVTSGSHFNCPGRGFQFVFDSSPKFYEFAEKQDKLALDAQKKHEATAEVPKF